MYFNFFRKSLPSFTTYSYGGYNFSVPSMSAKGITLTPKPYLLNQLSCNSQIINDIHSIWDINKFRTVRTPLKIGEIGSRNAYSHPVKRILDMPIKLSGSNEYKLPLELAPYLETIQMIINHEHSILNEEQLLAYNAYLTIDQSDVQKGTMQRKPGAHVDGFQGARIFPKTIINHSYVVSNGSPTVFYPHAFDFSHLDERVHNMFLEMDAQAKEEDKIQADPYGIYLMDAYTVHRADHATCNFFRTFLRLSYDVKTFDRLGNTINPLLSYSWKMVPREAQSTLIQYQSLSSDEKNLFSEDGPEQLQIYLNTLKSSNRIHYYNVCYFGLLSSRITIAKLIIENLLTGKDPNIQDLRLLFIATSQENRPTTYYAKSALIQHALRMKHEVSAHLFLDFILEIITQNPAFFSKKLLSHFILGKETTPQGEEILKLMGNHSCINASSFWNTKKTFSKDFNLPIIRVPDSVK